MTVEKPFLIIAREILPWLGAGDGGKARNAIREGVKQTDTRLPAATEPHFPSSNPSSLFASSRLQPSFFFFNPN